MKKNYHKFHDWLPVWRHMKNGWLPARSTGFSPDCGWLPFFCIIPSLKLSTPSLANWLAWMLLCHTVGECCLTLSGLDPQGSKKSNPCWWHQVHRWMLTQGISLYYEYFGMLLYIPFANRKPQQLLWDQELYLKRLTQLPWVLKKVIKVLIFCFVISETWECVWTTFKKFLSLED